PVGREFVDRNPANINHKLPPRTHGEHQRADRVATNLQNLSDCFHPHCGRDHSRPLCNRLSPAASFPFTGYSRPTCLLPASRARPFQATFHKPTKLPDANSLLSRPRTMQPAATESPDAASAL